MREHNVERRAAARAATFEKRRLKPAAMLVGAFEIHHRLVAARFFNTMGLPLDVSERRKVLRVLEHESMRRAGIEPDVENIVDFLPVVLGELAEEAFARARLIPGVGALLFERLDDADIDIGIVEDIDRAIRLLLDEHRDRHAPGTLAGDHPIRARCDHSPNAVLALSRNPPRRRNRFVCTLT